MADHESTAIPGIPRWSSFLGDMGDGDGSSVQGSSMNGDEVNLFEEDEEDEEEMELGDGGGLHDAAPGQGSGTAYPHFGNSKSPWVSTSAVFGDNGENPVNVIVLEIEAESFESNGGDITLDAILNVDFNDEMPTAADQRREAVSVLLNLLLEPTVGGSVANGTTEEEDDSSDKKERVYEYTFKDPNNPDLAHPCFTIHIEEVPDQTTGEPYKYRVWYMVWDPGFTITRSIISQLVRNNITYKDAHTRGTAAAKKKQAAQGEISNARSHIKTRHGAITNGGDLHEEFSKYFGDRSIKVSQMTPCQYLASMTGNGLRHPCAFENMLNPRDAQHGPTVLSSTPTPPNVVIHAEQSDPLAYFTATGAFFPPQYVRDNTLFHTLHPKFTGKRDVRLQTLPSRGVQSPDFMLLIDHFASVFLKEYPDLSGRTKARCFEAYLAGKDHNPANTSRSREESLAWGTAMYGFSGNRYAQKTETKDGVRREINPLNELRVKHDRLDRLLDEGSAKRAVEANQKLHAAARAIVLKNLNTTMEQRKKQLPLGTRHAWQEGVELLKRRKTPMSKTHDRQHMKNKSMFHGFYERFVIFVRTKLGAQDPTLMFLFLINSMASSTGEPGFIASIFGPAGVGKSTLMHLFQLMSLDNMNQESQIQSLKARLRSDPYNGYHEWLDEASSMFEGLKISNKTAEQLDQLNMFKRKVTERTTAHGIPEEVTQEDGSKVLQDVQLLVQHSQSITMLHNGNAVFDVLFPKDMDKSVLRRLVNYGAMIEFIRGREKLDDKRKNTKLMEECEDYKKNEFLTRCLLILGQVSSEFEVDCVTAHEIFRRMDLADGRPLMESGSMGHRLTIFKIIATWNAALCVFDCPNYHDKMPELFEDGSVKPWSVEMMTLCVPFLKAPDESIINFAWHFYDMLCIGRGPIVDQTLSLLANQTGFNFKGYTPPNTTRSSFTNQDLETIYSKQTITDVLAEVTKAEANGSHTLDTQRKTEISVTGMCNFVKEKVHGKDYVNINWNLLQTGVGSVKELAHILYKESDRKLGLTEEIITGSLAWLFQYVTEYKGAELHGPSVEGNTQFSYQTSTAAPDDTDDTDSIIHAAIYKYGQFPAMLAVTSGRSKEQDAIVVSKKGAANDKRQRTDNERSDANTSLVSNEFGLCVQTHVVRDHALRDQCAKQYAKDHPQIQSDKNFLHRHGLFRAKEISDKVFDWLDQPGMEMVTPYFHDTTLSPLSVKTDGKCDHSIWTTSSKNTIQSTLTSEQFRIINGVTPKEGATSCYLADSSRDHLNTSDMWMDEAFTTLDRFGWATEDWFPIVHDARTNGREHRNGHVFEVNLKPSSATTSSSASTSSSATYQKKTFTPLQ